MTAVQSTEKTTYQLIHEEFEFQIRTALARGKNAARFSDGKLDDATTIAAIETATKRVLESVSSAPVVQTAA